MIFSIKKKYDGKLVLWSVVDENGRRNGRIFKRYSSAGKHFEKVSGLRLRSLTCDDFAKSIGVSSLCLVDSENTDGSFRTGGCDCCDSGATDVFESSGYNIKTKSVVEGYEICWPCLCYFANGVDCFEGDVI